MTIEESFDLLYELSTVVQNALMTFNIGCAGLEAWQISSYTISACCFATWFWNIVFSKLSFLLSIRTSLFKTIRSLPWVKRRMCAELERARHEIEEEVHQFDQVRDFYKFLPEKGIDSEAVLTEARQYASMGERRFMEHYDPATRAHDMSLCTKVFDLFSHSDPHRSDAFPGVRKMEAEILAMCSSMFHADKGACGVVVGGGTEAMLLACLAYRNRALAKGIVDPAIVAATTAHVALDKATFLFGMRVKRVEVDENDRLKVDALRLALDEHTCMVVVSAPNHVSGTIDPIEKIAQICHKRSIPMHVDCSLGGFLLPFMEYCDLTPPSFDFRLAGVSSISSDIHRYGQCPRSCSVLMYRSSSTLRHQCFVSCNWPVGPYGSPSFAGGRDGGIVATAWATLLSKGRDGYISACHSVVGTTRTLADELSSIDGVELYGSSNVCVIAFTTKNVDIYAVVDAMIAKGWHVDAVFSPPCARLPVTLSMCNDKVIDALLTDLQSVMKTIELGPSAAKSSKTSAYYRMLKSMTDEAVILELTLMRLQAHYSIPSPPERRAVRTLSVDGRKLSSTRGMAADAARAVAEVRKQLTDNIR